MELGPQRTAGERSAGLREAVRLAFAVALAASALSSAAGATDPPPAIAHRLEPIRRFAAEEARQAVAVDADYFFAIDDRRIGKYSKETGERVAAWTAPAGAPIVHLNSGVVLDGRLYCAHSNYPALPMRSSIESFDAATLEHVGSQPLGLLPGSATWVDRRDGVFFVGLANYAGRGGAPGRGPESTTVARFDASWHSLGGHAFPEPVIERFGTHSNSGGAFGPDGLLYATGHDAAEVYALRVPAAGLALELVETVPAEATGQGIAWDPAAPDVLWTIRRDSREVVASRLVAP